MRDAMIHDPPPEACPECGSATGPADVIQRFSIEYYRTTGQAYRAYTCANAWHAAERARRLQQRLLSGSGLLGGELGLTLDRLLERGEGSRRMVAAARRMIERPYGMLTIWGGPGNGKTFTLQALVNHYMSLGLPAVYTRLADLLDHLRQGYDPAESVNSGERYRDVAGCKMLALDEFDKPRMTEWAREVTFILMDDRYRHARQRGELQRYTVIAMNEDPECLPAYILSRLRYDLLRPDGFSVVHNLDADARESGL